MADEISTSSPKRFVICFWLGFALMFLGILTVHVLGNPDKLFPSPIVPCHEDRDWKSRRVMALLAEGKPPEAVILGSSRMKQVSPQQVEAITGLRTFNYAVGGATCVESLAQMKSLLRRGIKPKLLIIGVDERGLIGIYDRYIGLALEDWHSFRELPREEQAQHAWRAFSDINFMHTHAAIRNIFRGPPPLREQKPQNVDRYICDNGYMVYGQQAWARQNKPWDPQQKRKDFLGLLPGQTPATRWRRIYARAALDQAQISALRQLAQLCRRNNIHLKVFTTPLQPDYDRIAISRSVRQRLKPAVRTIQRTCQSMGFEFFDFRNIQSFDGLAIEFWDSRHVTPVNMKRIINKIFNLDPLTQHAGVPDDLELVRNPPAITTMNVW